MKPPRHKAGEKFLRGPIPWAWLQAAAQSSGRAFHVAIALWHQVGLRKLRTVKFCLRRAEDLGVNRHAARRGLRKLQDAGLIVIEEADGQCHAVTILDTPAKAGD